MFALAFTALMPYIVLGDKICFDMEAFGQDKWGERNGDDEVHEETNSKVCAYIDGHWRGRCKNGIKKNEADDTMGCLYFRDGELKKHQSFKVRIFGSDAMWIDRMTVYGSGWSRTYGSDNGYGWCFSTDRNDHLDWKYDGYKNQSVPDDDCYHTLYLKANGDVLGDTTNEPRLCREYKTMNCKQGCESGWTFHSTASHFCCKSVFDCGSRKKCMRHSECRRRSEDGDAGDVEATSEDQEGKDNLVQLLPPQADLTDESSTTGAADRLQAMLSDIDAEFDSWTELAPADETPSSEVVGDLDDMIPAGVSTGDRRRRPPVAWPEMPENPTICKVRRTMKCKQRCPRGWKKVGAKGFGCCSSFGSCGGHRKICEKKTICPLRRRAGVEGSSKGDE